MFNVPAQSQHTRPVILEPIIPTKGQAAELAAIIMTPALVWQSALERLVASYRPASETTTDSPADSEAVINAIEGDLNVLMLSIGARVREWTVRVERWHRQKWVDSVYSATKVDLRAVMTGTAVEESVEAFVARNVALIKDVGAEAQRRISDAIFRGYTQRLSAAEIAREIRKAVKMGKDRSIRIAGDQNSKLSAALDKERQLEAGITYGMYRHSGKKHPRQWHKARNGKIYNLKTRREVDRKTLKPKSGGDRILPEDWPGYPPFCGCRMGAWLPVEREVQQAA